MNNQRFVLRAFDRNGRVHYYTGRAGDPWTSSHYRDAFIFDTLEYARRRATSFNMMEEAHGLWFVTLPYLAPLKTA